MTDIADIATPRVPRAHRRLPTSAIITACAAVAGGLLAGWVDLGAAEVQGPALLLMIVCFACAVPRRAPAWLIAIAGAAGIPIMHAVASPLHGDPPNAGMLIALVPAFMAAFAGSGVGIVIEDATRALARDAALSITRPAVIASGLGACALIGVAPLHNAIALRGADQPNLWLAIVWQVITFTAWCAAAPIIVRRMTRADGGAVHEPTSAIRVFAWAALIVPLAALHALVLLALSHALGIDGPTFLTGNHSSSDVLVSVFLVCIAIDALATGTILLLAHATDAERLRRVHDAHAREMGAALDRSRLTALNAQLRPHFIFNALNSVVMLARRDNALPAADAATALADLMRYALQQDDDSPHVTLRDEMEFAETWLSVEKMRFADRLTIDVQCDARAGEMIVPRLLLQPIIENAVRHGVARSAGPGEIRVNAVSVDNVIQITVEDNGPGPLSPTALRDAEGLGLRATRERMRAVYGSAARVEFSPLQPHGLRVRLTLPAVNG